MGEATIRFPAVYADDLMRPWLDSLREHLPDLETLDVHTHTGANDPDGFGAGLRELLTALDVAEKGSRAVFFTMHEPDGYRAANDRVLAEAKEAEGRLVPFCRVDPRDNPVAEAERCLDQGAQGIKLHPRAEQFTLDLPAVDALFALADERRLPILIHAGRGIPALGRDVLDLCERREGARAILAHAGICDLAWLWRESRQRPNLFFDTSWWSSADLLALLALVPPGQVLYGSDTPYGTPVWGVVVTARCALQAGLSAEQVRAVMGGQAERLVAGEDPLDLGPAPGPDSIAPHPLLDRAHTYLVAAAALMLNAYPARELLDLTRLACEVGEDSAQAPVCRSILALLDRQERHESTTKLDAIFWPGVSVVLLAACLARTADVPLPPDPEPEDVDERRRR
jgi:uncharacterized protein